MQDLNTFQANYGGFDFFNVWAPPNQSEQGGDATATSNVGSYAINQTGAQALGSYRLVLSSGAPSVTPRPLTLTPGPLSRLYGGANPTTDTDTDTASADAATANSGLVHGDSVASVSVTSGTAVFTTTATSTSNVGQYAILGSGLSASSANYGFSFAQASGNATALTINPAQL